MTKFTYF